jgi:hypothetical protein
MGLHWMDVLLLFFTIILYRIMLELLLLFTQILVMLFGYQNYKQQLIFINLRHITIEFVD